MHDEVVAKRKKWKKMKNIFPRWIYVFDDINQELKSLSLSYLIATHRHFRTCLIISSQYFNYLRSEARINMNYLLITGSIPEKKLKDIYTEFNPGNMSWEDFFNLYAAVTSKPHTFLYISRVHKDDMRVNFNYKIVTNN